MDSDIKEPLVRLWNEAKKDMPFFGPCGFAVALLYIWQFRAKQLGLATNQDWSGQLLSDFISFNAFGLIFFGYLLLGCLNTLAISINRTNTHLERMLGHVEDRLVQLGSAIICFMAGLLILVLIASIINLDSGGLALLAACSLFSGFMVATYVMASLVTKRVKPFDHPITAIITFVVVLGTLGWLVFCANSVVS